LPQLRFTPPEARPRIGEGRGICEYESNQGEASVSEETNPLGEITVDQDNLYREETFTDLKVASIRRLTPIEANGSDDTTRPVLFIGETTLMSARGPLPINCPIEATTLDEAINAFPQAVQAAVERLMEEAREMQRQEASRIVVPGQAPPGGGRIIG
jgi:hypothetical protein